MIKIDINKDQIRPICTICGSNPCKKNGLSKLGFQLYVKLCSSCEKGKYNLTDKAGRQFGYKRHKKDTCELCGFIPINKCQLDVDNIDGNRNNNEEYNLQTLCANCHRLKSYLFSINKKD